MNKKIVLIAAAAAMTLGGATAASAQAYGGYGYDRGYADRDRDGRPDHREWNRDRDRDGRPDQYDRYDRRGDRYGYRDGYRGGQRWRQGQVYSNYRNDRYVIRDYRAYGLAAPRPGYRYYRDNNSGDVVMAAIASGIIGLVIGSALSDNDNRGYDRGYYPY